jgi:hypothetical protein
VSTVMGEVQKNVVVTAEFATRILDIASLVQHYPLV